ncbi:PTS system sorbitol-specific enzyme IIA [Streptococcus varani]|jgi:PTS system glucitol/sorbitol-specific IIA component|uniref:PTS system sorbitol-specific enzyme IIA n=1 Tax=Streptococcus varani TaxID=1608583 RepID=A0A0E4H3N9_9STRE|nr:PTS glucitol/sorbitol transporter subunit IIA [Streptococcus varani]CQR23653.1 PTS system sorbitol-specific enzyme IIA [Streptococcus varani]
MSVIFETKVVAIGPEALGMIEGANMLILFGEEAPADLAEFCFSIDNKNLNGPIQVGGKLIIDNQEFVITAVGDLVEKNLRNLGHISVNFDGSADVSLPGTLHAQADCLPTLEKGTIIKMTA